MNKDLTSVIVPAWRHGDPPPIAALVRSLAETVSTPFEIVVACNGQDPSLVEYLRGEPAVTRAAYLTQNSGVSRAWNIGAHMALGDYLVFVNEDVVVGPGCIDGLVSCLRGDPSIGMVGPRGALWEFAPDRARHIDYVSGDGAVACDMVSGFLFAMPRAALIEAGMFDDEYSPASCEEVDVAQAVRRTGRKLIALGGLAFEHDWGVSAWDPERPIAWLGQEETTGGIHLRNMARLVRKWGSGASGRTLDGRHYDRRYFERRGYPDAVTTPRTIGGRARPPFLQTMADVVEATGVVPEGGSVLDVGCAFGLLVQELGKRGYDARGVDFSADAVAASPVRDRIWQGNALEMPGDRRYDAVVADGVFEHMNDAEARLLVGRILSVSDVLVVVVNKDRTEASHVNVKSNRGWLKLFAGCGLGFDAAATCRGRRRYLHDGAGPEAWHVNLLVVSARRRSRLSRLAARTVGDLTPAWRTAGHMGFLWR
jgi:glycosyltransferase involved in cell wall biosynthesis/SAM-dependent methyltransferase